MVRSGNNCIRKVHAEDHQVAKRARVDPDPVPIPMKRAMTAEPRGAGRMDAKAGKATPHGPPKPKAGSRLFGFVPGEPMFGRERILQRYLGKEHVKMDAATGVVSCGPMPGNAPLVWPPLMPAPMPVAAPVTAPAPPSAHARMAELLAQFLGAGMGAGAGAGAGGVSTFTLTFQFGK